MQCPECGTPMDIDEETFVCPNCYHEELEPLDFENRIYEPWWSEDDEH